MKLLSKIKANRIIVAVACTILIALSSQTFAQGDTSSANKRWNILHLGDSHIKSGHASRPIRDELESKYGDKVNFTHYGVNGASFVSFTKPNNISNIVSKAPDIIIISLGTNDSYSNRFNAENFRGEIQRFIKTLQQSRPNVRLIFTTPPASYLRQANRSLVGHRGKGRRRRPIYSSTTSYTFNRHTLSASDVIKSVAKAHGYAFVDLNSAIGKVDQAEEWIDYGLMSKDRVHYTTEGYKAHGTYIASQVVEIIDSIINEH